MLANSILRLCALLSEDFIAIYTDLLRHWLNMVLKTRSLVSEDRHSVQTSKERSVNLSLGPLVAAFARSRRAPWSLFVP